MIKKVVAPLLKKWLALKKQYFYKKITLSN